MGAIARLLKPGGIAFTNIPNMTGTIGSLQRILNRPVYDIHVPLGPEDLARASAAAGLEVLAVRILHEHEFGICSLNDLDGSAASQLIKRICVAGMARLSMGAWILERVIGPLSTSRRWSPYVNCVARKL